MLEHYSLELNYLMVLLNEINYFLGYKIQPQVYLHKLSLVLDFVIIFRIIFISYILDFNSSDVAFFKIIIPKI